jgi:hypothetical protein
MAVPVCFSAVRKQSDDWLRRIAAQVGLWGAVEIAPFLNEASRPMRSLKTSWDPLGESVLKNGATTNSGERCKRTARQSGVAVGRWLSYGFLAGRRIRAQGV